MPEQFSVSPDRVVAVTGGAVRGVVERGVQTWRGIPYAAPPVGARRLRRPEAVVAWTGVRDGGRFGSAAPQAARRRRPGDRLPATSEDCLTVNVTAPLGLSAGSAPLPVMVFIHGGGYSGGSSRDFSGQGEGFVLAGPVVYVSFNYRLGPLGYLDFSGYSTPARRFDSNIGLRDQIAALEWVQANISAFGGDPRNVTVFGESAGGNAVTTLLGTPAAAGLFSRAIAQSSPAYAVYDRTLAAKWAAEFVALLRGNDPADAGRDPASAQEAAEVQKLLDSAPVPRLLAASHALQMRTPDADPGTFCLAPVVDGELLPESPLSAIRAGRAHPVPLVIGTNDREGSIFRRRMDILPGSPHRMGALFSVAPEDGVRAISVAYPGLPAPRSAADFGGDYAFWYPSTRVADFHSRFAPVHVYRFDVAPRLLKLVGLHATHSVEMFALFDRLGEPLSLAMTALGGREPYARAGARMRRAWLRFARDGSLPDSWPAFAPPTRATLIIDEEDRVERDPRRERRLAWNRFLPELGGPAAELLRPGARAAPFVPPVDAPDPAPLRRRGPWSAPLRRARREGLPLRSLPLRSLPLPRLPLRSLPLRSLPLPRLPLPRLPLPRLLGRGSVRGR